MALRTLGTNANNSLSCLTSWGQAISDADIAAISQSVVDDSQFASILAGGSPGAGAVLTTGSTHTNTTLDTLVSTGGGPLSSIAVGMLVLGVGIPPATFVSAIPTSTSVTLSQAATASASIRAAFISMSDNRPALSRSGQLIVPRRGTLNLWPGDIVAIDNTGAVIVVPASAIGYAGSLWTLT